VEQPHAQGTTRRLARPSSCLSLSSLWRSSLLSVLALLSTTGLAVAQADNWQKVWAETVAAAKKEGAVACGCPLHPGSRGFLLSQWAKDFPEIKLEYTGARLPDWPARVEAERAANQYLWDTFFTGPGPEVYRLAVNQVFAPLLDSLILPDVRNPKTWGGWDTAFYDKDRKRMLSFWQDLTAPYYNAAVVREDEVAAKGLGILLEPKYKGRIVWWDPRSGGSGSNAAVMIHAKLGTEGLRRLLVDQEPVFVRDATAMAERMVRGSALFSLGPALEEPLKPFEKAGVKSDIRPLGNSPDIAYSSTSYGIASIFERPAHPNAAKVFINWLLSRDIQAGLSKAADQRSRRIDVPAAAGLPVKQGGSYIDVQREEYLGLRQEVIRIAAKYRPQ
jgi:iron(III) transport system substrate-binding protein